jgi:hypothetical protein
MLVEWSYGFCTYEYCVISLSFKHILKQERSHNSYNEYRKQYPVILYCKTKLEFAINKNKNQFNFSCQWHIARDGYWVKIYENKKLVETIFTCRRRIL